MDEQGLNATHPDSAATKYLADKCREWGESFEQPSALGNVLLMAAEKLAEFEAVEARLPKTADGVPVVLQGHEDDTYYCNWKDAIEPVSDWVWDDALEVWRGRCPGISDPSGMTVTRPIFMCFSTWEAAQAAIAGALHTARLG